MDSPSAFGQTSTSAARGGEGSAGANVPDSSSPCAASGLTTSTSPVPPAHKDATSPPAQQASEESPIGGGLTISPGTQSTRRREEDGSCEASTTAVHTTASSLSLAKGGGGGPSSSSPALFTPASATPSAPVASTPSLPPQPPQPVAAARTAPVAARALHFADSSLSSPAATSPAVSSSSPVLFLSSPAPSRLAEAYCEGRHPTVPLPLSHADVPGEDVPERPQAHSALWTSAAVLDDDARYIGIASGRNFLIGEGDGVAAWRGREHEPRHARATQQQQLSPGGGAWGAAHHLLGPRSRSARGSRGASTHPFQTPSPYRFVPEPAVVQEDVLHSEAAAAEAATSPVLSNAFPTEPDPVDLTHDPLHPIPRGTHPPTRTTAAAAGGGPGNRPPTTTAAMPREQAKRRTIAAAKLTYEEQRYREALSHSLGLPTATRATAVFSYHLTPNTVTPPPPPSPSPTCNEEEDREGRDGKHAETAGCLGSTVSAAGITFGGERSSSSDTTATIADGASAARSPRPAADPTGRERGQGEELDGMRTPPMMRSPSNNWGALRSHYCRRQRKRQAEGIDQDGAQSFHRSASEEGNDMSTHQHGDTRHAPSSLMLPPTALTVATRAAGLHRSTLWDTSPCSVATPEHRGLPPRHYSRQQLQYHRDPNECSMTSEGTDPISSPLDENWNSFAAVPRRRGEEAAATPREHRAHHHGQSPNISKIPTHSHNSLATPVAADGGASPNTFHVPAAMITPTTASPFSTLLGPRTATTTAIASALAAGRRRPSSSSAATTAAALCTPVRRGDNDLCPLGSFSSQVTPINGSANGQRLFSGIIGTGTSGASLVSASPLAAYIAGSDTFATPMTASTAGGSPNLSRSPLVPTAVPVAEYGGVPGGGGGHPFGPGVTPIAPPREAVMPSSSLLVSTSAAPRPFSLERKLNVSSLEMKVNRNPLHWGCFGLVVALQSGVYVLSSAVETGKDRVVEVHNAQRQQQQQQLQHQQRARLADDVAVRVTVVTSTVHPCTTGAVEDLLPAGEAGDASTERAYIVLGQSDGSYRVQSYRLRSRASAVAVERREREAAATALATAATALATAATALATAAAPPAALLPLYSLPELVGELVEERTLLGRSTAPVTALHIAGHTLFAGDMAGMLSIVDLRAACAPPRAAIAPGSMPQPLLPTAACQAARTPPMQATWVSPHVRRAQQQQQQQQLRKGASLSEGTGDGGANPLRGLATTEVRTPTTGPSRRPSGAPIHHFPPPSTRSDGQAQLPSFPPTTKRGELTEEEEGEEVEGGSVRSARADTGHSLLHSFLSRGNRSPLLPKSSIAAGPNPVHLHVGESIFHIAVTPDQDRVAVGTTHNLLVYRVNRLRDWAATASSSTGGGSVCRPEPLVVLRHSAKPVRAFDWLSTPYGGTGHGGSSPSLARTTSDALGGGAISGAGESGSGRYSRSTTTTTGARSSGMSPILPSPSIGGLAGLPGFAAAAAAPTAMRASPLLVFAGGAHGEEVCVYSLNSRRVIARRDVGRPIHLVRCCPRSTDIMVSLEVGDERTLRGYRDVGDDAFFLTNHSNNVSSAATGAVPRTPPMIARLPAGSSSTATTATSSSAIATPVGHLFSAATTTTTRTNSSATPVRQLTLGGSSSSSSSSMFGSAIRAAAATLTPAHMRLYSQHSQLTPATAAAGFRDGGLFPYPVAAREQLSVEDETPSPAGRSGALPSASHLSIPPGMPSVSLTLPNAHQSSANDVDEDDAADSIHASSIHSGEMGEGGDGAGSPTATMEATARPPPVATTAAALPPPPRQGMAAAAVPLPAQDRAPLLHLEVLLSQQDGTGTRNGGSDRDGRAEAGVVDVVSNPPPSMMTEDDGAAEDERAMGMLGAYGRPPHPVQDSTATIRLRGFSDLGTGNAYVEDCVYGAFSPDCVSFVTAGPGAEAERHARVWNPFRLDDDRRRWRVTQAATAAAAASQGDVEEEADLIQRQQQHGHQPQPPRRGLVRTSPPMTVPTRESLFSFSIGGDDMDEEDGCDTDGEPGEQHRCGGGTTRWLAEAGQLMGSGTEEENAETARVLRRVTAGFAQATTPTTAEFAAHRTLR